MARIAAKSVETAAGMAPFSERLANARTVATHRRIIVSDIERRLGTYYTRDTLKRLAPVDAGRISSG